MNEKIRKKAEVIAAIALMLFSAIVIAGSTQALEPKKGTIDFVLLYDDVETGDSYYLSDVSAYLYDMNGHMISVSNSTSNGIVEFDNVVYGNYVVRTETVQKGGFIYKANFATVNLGSGGLKNIVDGSDFTHLTVSRYSLSHTMNLTLLKNGLPINANVELYFDGCMFANATVYGNNTFSIPEGITTVAVSYNDGGVYKKYYRDVNVAPNTKNLNVTVNIGNYTKVMGTVRYNSKIVSTITHVIVINKTTGSVWKTLTFNGGAFSFYLPSSNYKLVITANGYSVVETSVQSSFMDITVSPVISHISYKINLSNNMSWANVSMSMQISNKSVLYSLPYSDTGVLYYQMELLGWSTADLEKYLESRYVDYTSNLITVNDEVYAIDHSNSNFTVINSAKEEFLLTINTYYHNSEINKYHLLKNGKINIGLYAKQNTVAGAKENYSYTLNIPYDLERSNEISEYVASVTGYVGSIVVNNVLSSNPINIALKERKSPEIILDNSHLLIGWNNMTNANHIVNQSADNYTVVIPAYKNVWVNASKMVYDVVRNVYDPENTTYTWLLDGKDILSGKGAYNSTLHLSHGMHTLNIKVKDIGDNFNQTNITLLADNIWPTVNVTIKDPAGKVIAHLWTDNSSVARIDYNISGKTGHAWRNGTTHIVKIGQVLSFNQSEEIVYNAAKSFDTYNGVNKTNLPVIVMWDFNGNNSSGANKTFAFDKPTRKSLYYVNVTLSDSVNNTIIISMKVKVKDITPPVVKLNFTANNKSVNEVMENENITMDATGSYDPDNGTIASYNWTIKNEDYKVVNLTSGIYDIVNGSFASGNVTLVFHQFGTYYIIVNVTDGAGNHNVVNKTLRVNPVRPNLGINSVNIKGNRIEGTKLTFEVNVSNTGSAVASTYWISIKVNGKVVTNETFKDLKNGSYAIHDLYWTPPSPGNYSLKITVGCSREPASFLGDNEKV